MHAELGELRDALATNDELRGLLDNPEIETSVKSDVLVRVADGADELVVNFLRLLAEKGRAGDVAEAVGALDGLVAVEQQVLDVELTTAHDLSEAELGRILGQIEQAAGRKVRSTRQVDPDLIGGIVLQAGSMRLDASVRGRLERLRHELLTARS